MALEDLKGLDLSRLYNLHYMNLKLLEHYIVRDDQYTKEDILNVLTDLYKINTFIKTKLYKNKKL